MRMPLALQFRHYASRYLPFLKLTPKIDRDAVFRLRPVRNSAIEWETSGEGEALLKVPRRRDKIARLVAAVVKLPEARSVQLDEVGTFVWGLCDGSQTVDGIVKRTCMEYKMSRREVEISVTTYLQMLAERNFIGFYQKTGARK